MYGMDRWRSADGVVVNDGDIVNVYQTNFICKYKSPTFDEDTSIDLMMMVMATHTYTRKRIQFFPRSESGAHDVYLWAYDTSLFQEKRKEKLKCKYSSGYQFVMMLRRNTVQLRNGE